MHIERTVVEGNAKREERGMLYAFILSALVICSGGGLLYLGKDWTGFALIVSVVASPAGAFMYGKSKQRDELDKKIEAFPDRQHRNSQR